MNLKNFAFSFLLTIGGVVRSGVMACATFGEKIISFPHQQANPNIIFVNGTALVVRDTCCVDNARCGELPDTSYCSVRTNFFDTATLKASGSPIIVNQAMDGNQQYAQLFNLPNNARLALWLDGNEFQTTYGRITDGGGISGDAFPLKNYGYPFSAVTFPDGTFDYFYTSNNAIQRQHYSATGVAVGVEEQVNASPPNLGNMGSAKAISLADGAYVIVYPRQLQDQTTSQWQTTVVGQCYNADRTLRGSEFNIYSGSADQGSPAVTATTDGGFVAAILSGSSFISVSFDNTCQATGNPVVVASNAMNPGVAFLQSTNTTVYKWERNNNVEVTLFSNEIRLRPDFKVNYGPRASESVVSAMNDTLVVAWTQTDSTYLEGTLVVKSFARRLPLSLDCRFNSAYLITPRSLGVVYDVAVLNPGDLFYQYNVAANVVFQITGGNFSGIGSVLSLTDSVLNVDDTLKNLTLNLWGSAQIVGNATIDGVMQTCAINLTPRADSFVNELRTGTQTSAGGVRLASGNLLVWWVAKGDCHRYRYLLFGPSFNQLTPETALGARYVHQSNFQCLPDGYCLWITTDLDRQGYFLRGQSFGATSATEYLQTICDVRPEFSAAQLSPGVYGVLMMGCDGVSYLKLSQNAVLLAAVNLFNGNVLQAHPSMSILNAVLYACFHRQFVDGSGFGIQCIAIDNQGNEVTRWVANSNTNILGDQINPVTLAVGANLVVAWQDGGSVVMARFDSLGRAVGSVYTTTGQSSQLGVSGTNVVLVFEKNGQVYKQPFTTNGLVIGSPVMVAPGANPVMVDGELFYDCDDGESTGICRVFVPSLPDPSVAPSVTPTSTVTPAPTSVPSASPAPSASAAPVLVSATPLPVSHTPSVMPSNAPSISAQPSLAPIPSQAANASNTTGPAPSASSLVNQPLPSATPPSAIQAASTAPPKKDDGIDWKTIGIAAAILFGIIAAMLSLALLTRRRVRLKTVRLTDVLVDQPQTVPLHFQPRRGDIQIFNEDNSVAPGVVSFNKEENSLEIKLAGGVLDKSNYEIDVYDESNRHRLKLILTASVPPTLHEVSVVSGMVTESSLSAVRPVERLTGSLNKMTRFLPQSVSSTDLAVTPVVGGSSSPPVKPPRKKPPVLSESAAMLAIGLTSVQTQTESSQEIPSFPPDTRKSVKKVAGLPVLRSKLATLPLLSGGVEPGTVPVSAQEMLVPVQPSPPRTPLVTAREKGQFPEADSALPGSVPTLALAPTMLFALPLSGKSTGSSGSKPTIG